jgi:hypothetical protein
MKRNFLLTFLFVLSCGMVFAQRFSNLPKAQLAQPAKAVPAVKKHFTGFETHDGQWAESVPPAASSVLGVVGNTVYDLQSNGGSGHRLHNYGNGNLSGVFTISLNSSGYPDRGTGYNTATGGVWGAAPTARIENARTGFTNLSVSTDGTEYTTSHLGAGKIRLSKRAPGSSTWEQIDIPSPTTVLWSRLAVGGADGKTVHMITSTMPTGNGGTAFQGMDGVVIYHRSQDGGATWDVQGALLPGIDSTAFLGTEVEGYAIDANGNNVAIAVVNTWNDCLLYTSADNGTTWEKKVANDFPLERYVVNTGYDPATLPADPGQPSSIYDIFTTDGTVDVIMDDQGIAHMFYGATYVNDSIIDDTGWSFYPGTNIGIVYFNSLMDDNSGFISGYCPDVDNDGVLGVTDISNYGLGLSTHPAGAYDANGNVYVVYSTVHELYVDANSNFNFRQPWICASSDAGQTWTAPKALLNPNLLDSDSTEVPFLECIFNSAARHVDDKVHVIFQADYSPLTFLNSPDTDTEPGDNSIRYVGYPANWALTGTENVPAETVKFSAVPNPANDRIVLQFNSDRTQESWVTLYDMQGRAVRTTTTVTVNAGEGVVNMNVADLADGMYIARLNLGNQFATQKVVVKH